MAPAPHASASAPTSNAVVLFDTVGARGSQYQHFL
jgi:hypothetical protein